MQMYVITGGAGFIGSNILAALDRLADDVVIVDWMGSGDEKWRNIAKHRLRDIVKPDDVHAFLQSQRGQISGVAHMGAISTTTEADVDKIVHNNFRLSADLWSYCAKENVPFVYASSAATYGNGSHGFDDQFNDAYLSALRPLNPYGWSKHLFDRWVLREIQDRRPRPPRWAGLKFFNVYGPNEYHKGNQRSVAAQLFEQIRTEKAVKLFKSDNPDYIDGGQKRDFVWIGDCVDVALWALKDPSAPSDLYNVGSGVARPFVDKATIMFNEMGFDVNIIFMDLPEALKGKYQYYTCANLNKLRDAGYKGSHTSLEEGLKFYIDGYLASNDKYR
jgi:ADP-L-glycero-D-manno-heptose 6-epimerase